jgi:hypothetical protein
MELSPKHSVLCKLESLLQSFVVTSIYLSPLLYFFFFKRDETIEVGAKLYEIDTEATSTLLHPPLEASTSAPTPDITTTTIPEDVSNHQITEFSITSSIRVPSIRFYGKEGWSHRLSGASQNEESLPVEPQIPTKPNGVVVLDGSMIHARYGRPDFTEDEMEALMLGGANMAPSSWNSSSNQV